MQTTRTAPEAHAGLLDWLRQHDVDHELHEHVQTFTARSTARAEGVPPQTFAKVVGVGTDDDRVALVLVDATDHVDLRKAAAALDASSVRLLDEPELAALAPDCEAGAIPAVGILFDVPMLADTAVREDPEISFNAGSHRWSVRVDRARWERAAEVRYADLASRGERPAWAAT